ESICPGLSTPARRPSETVPGYLRAEHRTAGTPLVQREPRESLVFRTWRDRNSFARDGDDADGLRRGARARDRHARTIDGYADQPGRTDCRQDTAVPAGRAGQRDPGWIPGRLVVPGSFSR